MRRKLKKKDKKRKIPVFENGKWKLVSVQNPNYEWKDGIFKRKPSR